MSEKRDSTPLAHERLADRYQTATPATARLRHLATSLKTLADTDFVNWKLLIASAKR
jgi:hypothetical protein